MTKLQYVARLGQMSALQSQMVSLAIEMDVSRDALVAETAKAYDEQLEAYKIGVAMIAQLTDQLTDVKAKA